MLNESFDDKTRCKGSNCYGKQAKPEFSFRGCMEYGPAKMILHANQSIYFSDLISLSA